MEAEKTISNQIVDWAATRPDEIVFEPKDGYYSFDIVLDAYHKGQSDLEKFKSEARKRYFDNAKIAAEIIVSLTKDLVEINISPDKLFINNSIDGVSIILTIFGEILFKENNLDKVDSIIFETQKQYLSKGIDIQISFLEDSKNLNIELLKADGFSFGFDFKKGQPIF